MIILVDDRFSDKLVPMAAVLVPLTILYAFSSIIIVLPLIILGVLFGSVFIFWIDVLGVKNVLFDTVVSVSDDDAVWCKNKGLFKIIGVTTVYFFIGIIVELDDADIFLGSEEENEP